MVLSEIYIENVTTYWVLRLSLLALLLFCGYGVTYKNSENRYFWYYAVPVIIFYVLIEGLRFDRGADYHLYFTELRGDWYAEGFREPLYDIFVKFVQLVGIPYWAVFMFYSGLIITSFLFVAKHFPKYAIWAFPLFFLVTDYMAETLIRQFIGISFIMFAFSAYLSDRKVLMFIMLMIVPLVHFSGLMAVGMFILLFFVNFQRFFKSPLYLLVIYVAAMALFDTSYLDQFSDIIQSNNVEVEGSTNTNAYLENSDKWLTDEGDFANLDIKQGAGSSKLYTMCDILFQIVMIVFGFYAAKEDKRLVIPYYFTYLALLLWAIGGNIELYGRFAWWYFYLSPLLIAAVIVRAKTYSVWYEYMIYIAVLIKYLYPLSFTIGQPGYSGAAFVWDII